MTQPHFKRGWSTVPEDPSPTPWYRQFWPWFLIALPASSVVAGLTTVWISLQDRDGLVATDYYKRGLAINERLERAERARAMGLEGAARFDPVTGDLVLQLDADVPLAVESLEAGFHHATRSYHDVTVPLVTAAGGRYSASLDEPLAPGRWWLEVYPPDNAWRIQGELFVRPEDRGVLTPNLVP
jgi:hypothetical protein